LEDIKLENSRYFMAGRLWSIAILNKGGLTIPGKLAGNKHGVLEKGSNLSSNSSKG